MGTLTGLLAAGCARVQPRPEPTASGQFPAEFGVWEREAKGMLSDAQNALHTFEDYAAFRVAIADRSDRRVPTDLAWDPPTRSAWDEATHVAQGLRGRAQQLLLNISNQQLDATWWREQRDRAEWSHELLDLADALSAHRTLLASIQPTGDGVSTWDSLERAWARWETSAQRWGTSRPELISCASG